MSHCNHTRGSQWRGSLARFCFAISMCFFASSLLTEDWPQWRGPRRDGTWEGKTFVADWTPEQAEVRWKKPIGGGYGGISVVGDKLYVMDHQPTKQGLDEETDPEKQASEKKNAEKKEVERVLCYRASDGELLWEDAYPVGYGKLDYGNGPRSTPTIAEGRVYTFGALGHARCLDAESGRLIWEKDPQQDFQVELPTWGLAASPLLVDDLVILHPGGKEGRCFVALDRETGKERWRAGKDPGGYATPILVEAPQGRLIVGWTPEHVVGLIPESGEIVWSIPYKVTYGVSIATPHYADGVVVVCGYWEGSKGIELGESLKEASLIWSEERTLRGLMNPPLYKKGRVFILDKQFGVTCFEIRTGKKLWDDKNTLTPRGRNPQANFAWLDQENSDRILALNAVGDLVLADFAPEGYEEIGRKNIIGDTWACPAFAGNSIYARSDTELVGVTLKPGK